MREFWSAVWPASAGIEVVIRVLGNSQAKLVWAVRPKRWAWFWKNLSGIFGAGSVLQVLGLGVQTEDWVWFFGCCLKILDFLIKNVRAYS